MTEKKKAKTECDGSYLELPPSINAKQVLETVSFIQAAYICRASEELDKGRFERVEERLEQASNRMYGFMDEIRDVIRHQGRRHD